MHICTCRVRVCAPDPGGGDDSAMPPQSEIEGAKPSLPSNPPLPRKLVFRSIALVMCPCAWLAGAVSSYLSSRLAVCKVNAAVIVDRFVSAAPAAMELCLLLV